MSSFSGQAVRHTGRALHALGQIVLAVVILAAVILGGLSWRLSRGPLEVPWLTERLAAAANADASMHLSLGSAALAWEGFREGVDRPLDIRVSNVSATDDAGNPVASIPRAEVSLSVGSLLLGRLVPRAIAIDGARLRVVRAADGTVTLDLGGAADQTDEASTGGASPSTLLREFSRPAAGDRGATRQSRWSQLRLVRIRDAAASIVDRPLGVTWQVPSLNADLRRRAQGGVEGQAEAKLLAGQQKATLTATAELNGDDHRTRISAHLSPLVPAALARDMSAAAALAAVDAPVGLSADIDLDADLKPVHLAASAELSAGSLHFGQGVMPVTEAAFRAEGTPDAMDVQVSRFVMSPRPNGPRTVVQAHANLSRRDDGEIQATGALDLDQVAFADLPALWPKGVGGPGTRPWITKNVTDGTARNGHVEVALTVPADMSDVAVTRVAGGIDGHDVTVHWLRPVPPVEHADARLEILTPDSLEISVSGGRQAGGSQGGLQVRNGHVVVSGLATKDQFADIDSDIIGTVPDLLTLLRDPKVKLLDKSPLKLQDTAGQLAGQVKVTRLPLRDDVSFDSVQIRTTADVTGLRLAGIAAGRDLDHGAFAVSANPDGLHAGGTAQVSGIPAQMQIDMDFRSGPATQVLQKVTLAGTIDATQIAALGLDPQTIGTGAAAFDASLAIRRDGAGDVSVNADLTRAALSLEQLNYSKPAGQAAHLSTHILLSGDHVAGIESLRVEGDGVHINGAADFADGAPSVLRLTQIALGTTTNAHGEIRAPSRAGGAWAVNLAGTSLDASGVFSHTSAPAARPTKPSQQAGTPWLVDAKFDRVIMGPGRTAGNVVLHAENDGQVVHRASLTGSTTAGAPFQITVAPQAGGRHLSGSTRDAGGLLRLFDVMDTMQDGRMTVSGNFDDTQPDHPLTGTAEIEEFRIRDAPVLAKLLQAMTLYGLVEAARGPGLGFTRLVAPFRFASDILTLSDARAFSSSLGMTAKGQVDLARQSVDMQGTIVPAYFFNSLLGNIPLVGKLFSPERGGGVFSATYSVRGKLSDPSISINPLAALTPGFLRGLFGLF